MSKRLYSCYPALLWTYQPLPDSLYCLYDPLLLYFVSHCEYHLNLLAFLDPLPLYYMHSSKATMLL